MRHRSSAYSICCPRVRAGLRRRPSASAAATWACTTMIQVGWEGQGESDALPAFERGHLPRHGRGGKQLIVLLCLTSFVCSCARARTYSPLDAGKACQRTTRRWSTASGLRPSRRAATTKKPATRRSSKLYGSRAASGLSGGAAHPSIYVLCVRTHTSR